MFFWAKDSKLPLMEILKKILNSLLFAKKLMSYRKKFHK